MLEEPKLSLRPSFSGFDLSKLTGVFGHGDDAIIPPLMDQLGKIYTDPAKLRRASLSLRLMVYNGPDINPPLEFEDEVFQVTMEFLSRHVQSHDQSTSLFWEPFMVRVDADEFADQSCIAELFGYLRDGRRFFGRDNASNWCYYSYLRTDEAVRLFDWITDRHDFQNEFGFNEAREWMERVRSAGKDVWYFAS